MAHPDYNCKGSMFYDAIAAASPKFREEIADIYFGTFFKYEYKGESKIYGNTMDTGIEPFGEEFEWLIKVQEDFGIPLSLTVNPIIHPHELMFDDGVIGQFVNWLQKHYDAGIRVCTISNVTLMRKGILQKAFPDMKWKNTVNHKIRTAQEYIDYVKLGYDYIQVDRSLNRNLDELRKIKQQRDIFGKEIYMLVHEDCMPECPMQVEHTADLSTGERYDVVDACSRWTSHNYKIPRVNMDAFWLSKEVFDEFSSLVDVFKYSGRFYAIDDGQKYEWYFGDRSAFTHQDWDKKISCESFEEVYERGHISWWLPMVKPNVNETKEPEEKEYNIDNEMLTDEQRQLIINAMKMIDAENENQELTKYDEVPYILWMTKEGKALERKLVNCMSQCYDCHLCERTFGIEDLDSILDIDNNIMSENDKRVYIKLEDIKRK